MARFIERLLNLERGDLRRGFLLFTYLFLVMASYMAARIARDAIFLDNFVPVDLAYVDLASALLVGFVVAAYLWVGRRISLPSLLMGSLLFYAVNLVAFWYVAEVYRPKWLSPVVYIWVSLYGALAPVQVWTLANYVLTTREAKRVFGLVGSGAIVGAVMGAKLSSLLAKRYSAESLLLAVAVAMVLCAVLVPFIWRRRDAILGSDPEARRRAEQAPKPRIVESLRLIGGSAYLRSIALLILVANISTSLAGWQFKALTKFFIPQKDALAAFWGDFYFYAGIAGFIVQLLVTGRLLRRFGLGPALLVVPMALVFGSTGVIVWGMVTIWAAVGLRSCINVLQYSIDKPSVELLYLPVPSEIKNQVKSFIDTVVWRFGDGLAAVAVLAFGKALGWTPVQVSWVVLVLLTGWMVAAVLSRRLYVDTLRESIHAHRLDAERASAPVLDRSATELLVDRLKASDPKEILYALNLFEIGHQQATHPAVRGLLSHPAWEVRQKAISILSAAGDTAVRPQVEALLKDPYLEVRTEALLYLARHAHVDPLVCIEQIGNFPDFSIRSGVVAFLARPGPAQDIEVARIMLEAMVLEAGAEGKRTRLEAARLLGSLPDNFEGQHERLLADEDADVVREAVGAAARRPSARFVHRLLALLGNPHVAGEAAEALAALGDAVVPPLRQGLADHGLPAEVRREIPAVLERIGTNDAAQALAQAILETDTQVRFKVICALNKIHQTHPELKCDRQMVETLLAAEIMGHYRSYQILGTLGPNVNPDDPVAKALADSMHQEIERVFRLLGLLHPRYDLHSAYYGVQSSNRVVHDNALEFLENVLEPQVRKILLPLVDSTVTVAERIELAGRVVGASVETREEAVAALLKSDDPWLQSCGAYAVGTLGLRNLEPELDVCLNHPDPLLREAARQAKVRLAALAQPARA